MSNTTTKVLTGCGVGCLLIVVALVGLGWMGYRWGKTAAEAGIAAEQAEDRLEAEYGRARDFTPPALLSGDRIEAFLVIRRKGEWSGGGEDWNRHGAARPRVREGAQRVDARDRHGTRRVHVDLLVHLQRLARTSGWRFPLERHSGGTRGIRLVDAVAH